MDLQNSPAPALILKSGDEVISKVTRITVSPFVIGRGAEASLKLPKKVISRKQCSIEHNETNWAIKSLGSRPVSVNSLNISKDSLRPLKCSDVIELPGLIKFEFKCAPDQNGRCCGDSDPNISVISFNDSIEFLTSTSIPSTSTRELSPASLSTDKPYSNSLAVEKVPPFDTDDLINIAVPKTEKVKSSSMGESNVGLLLDIDQLTEVIRTFANHLESKGTEAIDGNYSRLSDELKMRLEFAESIDTYRVDESCHAHERNGSINSLFDAVKKLSFVLDKKRIECPEIEEFKETSLSASVERIFLSIDVELLSQAKELADVLIKLPVGSVKSSDIRPIFTEGKVSGACRCKRNMKVFPKKRKEPVNANIMDVSDESNKVKWQEARIQYLQMKLKEKENVSTELESVREENDKLQNKVAELNRTLAGKDVMELEFKVLKETTRLRDEDKRSKDSLQERINSLQGESFYLKSENEKLLADLEKAKNDYSDLVEKNQKLEEKLKEKSNSAMDLGCSKDGGVGEDQCCELGIAKGSKLVELMESELNCSICGEMYIEPTVTNCNHAFCTHCLKEWKKMKKECPFCRTILVKECKISFLDEFINNLLKLFSPKLLAERSRLIQERIAPPVVPPPAKRARVTRGRAAAARGTRNSRARQNQQNPIPYIVDPVLIAALGQYFDLD